MLADSSPTAGLCGKRRSLGLMHLHGAVREDANSRGRGFWSKKTYPKAPDRLKRIGRNEHHYTYETSVARQPPPLELSSTCLPLER